MKKYLIIDGNSLAYRAYFAVPKLSTKSGLPTNALYGFITMFMGVVEKEKPDYVSVAFDLPQPTFRHKLYADYKATRQKAAEDFIVQLAPIKEFLTSLAVPILECAGYEADDIIGTVATKLHEKAEYKTYILTADRDVLQLVSANTEAYLTRKGITDIIKLNEKAVFENYQLEPSQIVDYKALRGDASDNIPGVSGVGEKTALQLIAKYQTLDNIYNNLETITPERLKNKLIEEKDKAYLSQELATIFTDVPVKIEFHHQHFDLSKISSFLVKYELKSIMSKYKIVVADQETNQEFAVTTIEVTTVDNEDKWNVFLAKLNTSKLLVMELISEEPDKLIGVGICLAPTSVYYIPLNHQEGNLDINDNSLGPIFAQKLNILASICKLIAEKDIVVCGNLKKILRELALESITFPHNFDDIFLINFNLYPDKGNAKLEDIIHTFLQEEYMSLEQYCKENKIQISEISAEQMAILRSKPLEATLRVRELAITKMKAELTFEVYKNIDLRLIEPIVEMERQGIKINKDYLKTLSVSMHESLQGMEESIYRLAGQKFNINSPKQLGDILYNKLSMPVFKKVKTGTSTDVSVLEKLAPDYEIAGVLMEYRQTSKLLNTYIDVLPYITDTTDRIHTTLNLTGAATGRLSSKDPNLQNIPIKTAEGEKIRRAFEAEQGKLFIIADYSQIELRVLSHIANVTKMIEAFDNNIDIHTATASELFAVSTADVKPSMRRKAKEINFGIAYGMQAYGLSQRLNIGQKEAATYIELYFAKYPQVKNYIEATIEQVKTKGYVSTLYGRKRYFHGYERLSKPEQKAIDRMAINTPIQGTAADIIKIAMVNLFQSLKPYKAKIILQIHDEIIVEAKEQEAEKIAALVRESMENVIKLKVPLTVNMYKGSNWLDAT